MPREAALEKEKRQKKKKERKKEICKDVTQWLSEKTKQFPDQLGPRTSVGFLERWG